MDENFVYKSDKGFIADRRKFDMYCLNPLQMHAKDFFAVGYFENDGELLFRDIEKCFNLNKKCDSLISNTGVEKFSIPMFLGMTDSKLFRTVWQKDTPNSPIRFISAYVDRRLKKEDE